MCVWLDVPHFPLNTDADYSEAPEAEGSNHSSPRMLRRSMRLFGNSGGFDKQLVNESESEDDSDYEPEHWKRVSQPWLSVLASHTLQSDN